MHNTNNKPTIFICIKITILMFLLVFPAIIHAQDILINEVMASNSRFYPDEDGSHEDWIELYNAGDEPVNLEGYGLSDDYDDPFKWTFPDYEMQPGEYLWIWASGKDRKDTPGQMHNGIKRRYYPGISGTSVDNLINHPSFPDHPYTREIYTNYFQAPTNVDDHYGQHMFTWLLAPQTGQYVFRIASDDNSRLYLSSDESTDNVVMIAEVPGWTEPRDWYKYSQQTSAPVFLEEGELYYLSALMKEGAGGDNLAVRMDLPDGSMEAPISALNCYLPETRFHTNFRISAAGEEIILTNPQGVRIDEMEPVEIPTDISYGRKPGQPDEWVYFSEPTPGAPNTTDGYHGLSPDPVISPPGGIFKQPVQVTISSPDPDAIIYYTTNGTKPSSSNGFLYSNPIWINNTIYLRAVAISPGKLPGNTVAATYSVANENLHQFSSNLPLMVIHSFNTPITPGFRTPAYMSLYDDQGSGRVELSENPTFDGRIKINIRGSSSQMFPKKGFGFHTLEEDDNNRKVELLGMPEEHNWILHGPYSDKSLIRNAFSYWIGEATGHYSPRTRMIELFMHHGSGEINMDHYHGVYVLTERIKIAPERVEIADIDLHHNEYPEVSGGYIFKIDRLNAGEEGFYTERGNMFVFVRPNELTITPFQRDYLKSYVDSLETALFGNNFTDPEAGYAAYMDVMSFIDMHLIHEVTKEIDGFRLSTFFYKDEQSKIKSGPLWDFNLALGNANYLQGWIPEGWYHELISDWDYNRGWYIRLFEDPAFAEKYNRRYRFLRTNAFSRAKLMGKILEYKELLVESQERNFERWDVLGHYVWPNWFIADSHQEEIEWMMGWLDQRLDWIDGQLGEPYTMMHYWNFNTHEYLEPTYTINDASLTIIEGSATEITTDSGQDFAGINARNGDMAGDHLRINNPIGTALTLNLPSTNYQQLTFSYEARRSTNGANRHYISYTTDGQTYIPFDTLFLDEKPQVFSLYFGDITETDDNEHFGVKITIAHDEEYAGGYEGNNRIDNLTLDGEALSGVIRPPKAKLPLPEHLEMIELGNNKVFNLADYFKHPDNMNLWYSVNNPDPDKVDISFANNLMIIKPFERGGVRVELEIADGINPPLLKNIYLLIYPAAAILSESDYLFNYWDPNEPKGSFPEHMLFVQGEQDDAYVDTDLLFAYSIPAWDYSSDDQGNIGFPYRNTSRTRINGLHDYGISFINTGRGRDLGAAILTVNTRGADDLELTWRATTLIANSRAYNLKLQYRTSINRPWKDWADEEGNPIEYKRNTQIGHTQNFGPLIFPQDAKNQEYVQIRWLYYFTGEQTDPEVGRRDMLGLEMIKVNGEPTDYPYIISGSNLYAYPNPVTDGVVFFNKNTTGALYNLQGHKIASVVNNDRIFLQKLPPGIYVFRSVKGESIRLVVGL